MISRTNGADFYPPRLAPALLGVVHTILPLAARGLFRLELAIAPESLQRLQALAGARRLLLPNHPTFQDPIVMFLLSARLVD